MGMFADNARDDELEQYLNEMLGEDEDFDPNIEFGEGADFHYDRGDID